MARCNNNSIKRGEITSADELKNIPVNTDNLNNGYSLVYENNQLVFKDVQGGGGGGATTFLQLQDTPASYVGGKGKVVAVNSSENALEFVDPASADKQDILDSIKEGANITIDRGTLGQITINSTGSGTGVAKLEDIGDVPQYSDGYLYYNGSSLEWSTIATGGDFKCWETDTSIFLLPQFTKAIIIFKGQTRIETQYVPQNATDNTFYEFCNQSTYDIKIIEEGKQIPIITIKPKQIVHVMKVLGAWKVIEIKNYDSAINTINQSLNTKLDSNSKIYDLSDVPTYDSATNNSVLTKTASGLQWQIPQGTGTSTFIDLTDTPSTYIGQKFKVVTVNEGENSLEFKDILGSIKQGTNITIDRGVAGEITINSTGGGGGGVTFTDEQQELTITTDITPYGVRQTGGTSYSTLEVGTYPCKVRKFSNGDMEAEGIVQFRISDLSSQQSAILTDAVRFTLYLPVPDDIEVGKQYELTRTGISIQPNPFGNTYTANTFSRSATSSSQVKYVLVQFAYNCFGVNNAYYKALSSQLINISFSVKLKAKPKVLRSLIYYDPDELIDMVEKGWI